MNVVDVVGIPACVDQAALLMRRRVAAQNQALADTFKHRGLRRPNPLYPTAVGRYRVLAVIRRRCRIIDSLHSVSFFYDARQYRTPLVEERFAAKTEAGKSPVAVAAADKRGS